MTVYIVPCGLSILDNLAKGKGAPPGLRGLHQTVNELKQWAKPHETWTGQNDSAGRLAGWLAKHPTSAILDPSKLDLHGGWADEQLSAEVASLALMPRPQADDRVVLLASDTAPGVLAALLNAVRLRRPARYWHGIPQDCQPTPFRVRNDRDPAPGQEGGTDVVRIPALIPNATDDFLSAMGQIGRLLRWGAGIREATEGGAVVHLAGGYKATIPLLVVLAEYLREALPKPDVKVLCKHEDHPGAVHIPLRRVDTSTHEQELEDFLNGTRAAGDLEGFAYQGTSGQVTPVGAALVSLFDLSGGVGGILAP